MSAKPAWAYPRQVEALTTSAWFADNQRDTVQALFRLRDCMDSMQITTSAPSIDLEFASTEYTNDPTRSLLLVQCPGQADVTVPVVANNTITTQTVTLPGALSTLTIIEGSQADIGLGTGDVRGTQLRKATVPSGQFLSVLAPTPPTRRAVVYGDSIASNGLPTLPQTQTWSALMRTDYPGRVTIDAWSGRSLHSDYVLGGDSIATLAAALAARCDGTVFNELLLVIGANDYHLAPWNAAAFQAQYQALLTAFRALSSAKVWAITPIYQAVEGVNAAGSDMPAYRTAIANAVAAAAIANCTLIDGTNVANGWFSMADVTGGIYYADGIHPNTTGHVKEKGAVKTSIGYP